MADTETPRTSWSPTSSAASAASGPSRHATVASCSRRAGAGTRYSCGTRAEATTLPSPSAATAFTDDVPISRPTVSSVMATATQRREHFVVQQAVRGDGAPAVGARDAFEIGEAASRGFDDHHRRREIPDATGPRVPPRCRSSRRPPSHRARSRRTRACANTAARAPGSRRGVRRLRSGAGRRTPDARPRRARSWRRPPARRRGTRHRRAPPTTATRAPAPTRHRPRGRRRVRARCRVAQTGIPRA